MHPKPDSGIKAAPPPLADSATAPPIAPYVPSSLPPPHIPLQWHWHYRALEHLRDRLFRAHADHARQLTAPVEVGGIDTADTAQEKIDRDLLWAELGAEDNKLFEIDCALQRLRDGVYGFCEETGHPIPRERLRAVPWTRYSRNAAARHEPPHPTHLQ